MSKEILHHPAYKVISDEQAYRAEELKITNYAELLETKEAAGVGDKKGLIKRAKKYALEEEIYDKQLYKKLLHLQFATWLNTWRKYIEKTRVYT